jgi:hypothetical protein
MMSRFLLIPHEGEDRVDSGSVEAPRDPTEHVVRPPAPQTQFSRLIKTLSQGYLSVSVYLNVVGGHDYYDVVIHRRVKARGGEQVWKRGANLKPTDLPDLLELLGEVQTYLSARGVKIAR